MIKNYNHYTEKELGYEMVIVSESLHGTSWWHEIIIRDGDEYWEWEFGTDERITLEGLASGKYDTLGCAVGSYKTIDDLIHDGISHDLATYALSERI